MIQRATAINGDSVRGTNHWSSRAQPLGKTARRSPEARAARIPSAGSRGWCCARHDARANFSRNPLLPPAGPEAQSLPRGLSLLGMPFSEAACALREGNYAPASRKDSSLALRPTPTAYLSIPSVKRVIRLAACQPQCTTNWRGRRVRSAATGQPGARLFSTASCRAWWARARGSGRGASAVRWGRGQGVCV